MTLITEGDNRRCDAACHDAKEPKCACICGGRFHGKKSGSTELRAAIDEFRRTNGEQLDPSLLPGLEVQ